MKCIMRTFSCLQGSVIPFLATLLPVLTQKLQQAAKNPTKPHFNHYIFETFCLAIRIVCTSQPGAVSNFEGKIFSYPDLNFIQKNFLDGKLQLKICVNHFLIDETTGWTINHAVFRCILPYNHALFSQFNTLNWLCIRCLVGSTDQACSSGFYFRIA